MEQPPAVDGPRREPRLGHPGGDFVVGRVGHDPPDRGGEPQGVERVVMPQAANDLGKFGAGPRIGGGAVGSGRAEPALDVGQIAALEQAAGGHDDRIRGRERDAGRRRLTGHGRRREQGRAEARQQAQGQT